jgi:HK97 family phage portal protein
MPSLIGKALALRNAAPVPMGGSGFYKLPGLALNSSDGEAFMRTHGNIGTVWQIVHLLSSNVAKPEWRLYRSQATDGRVRYTTNDQGSDDRVEVVKHQAKTVLLKPNPYYSRFGLFELSQMYMELTGECFWVIDRDPRSSIPLGLWPVRPDRMDEVPDAVNYLKGWIYTSPDGGEKVPLRPSDVIQVKYPNPLNPYRGLGPVQAVLVDIDAAKYSAEWNRNFFINSAQPGGVLQVDHRLGDDEWNELTNRWRESHRGVSRAHRVAVLEAGVTWIPNEIHMKDMDFANLRNVSRDLIREAWGIHKIMLGNSDDVNRANAQTGEEVFANWSVAPRLERWKDALNEQFLPLFGSAGDGVEWDFIYPLPQNREQDNAELMAKSSAALSLIQAGYDPADVLETVGLPAMGTIETKGPLNPAGTTPALASPDAGEQAAESAGGGDDPQNRLGIRAAKDAAAKVYEQVAPDYPASAMAWMHHASWTGPAKVPLDHIDPTPKWMQGADPEKVQKFVERIQKGKKVKPVIAVKTPKGHKLLLIDGHHRWLAYAELGKPVPSFIGTVDAEHGPWETMHGFQKDSANGGDDNPDNRLRQMAAWNALAGAR